MVVVRVRVEGREGGVGGGRKLGVAVEISAGEGGVAGGEGSCVEDDAGDSGGLTDRSSFFFPLSAAAMSRTEVVAVLAH